MDSAEAKTLADQYVLAQNSFKVGDYPRTVAYAQRNALGTVFREKERHSPHDASVASQLIELAQAAELARTDTSDAERMRSYRSLAEYAADITKEGFDFRLGHVPEDVDHDQLSLERGEACARLGYIMLRQVALDPSMEHWSWRRTRHIKRAQRNLNIAEDHLAAQGARLKLAETIRWHALSEAMRGSPLGLVKKYYQTLRLGGVAIGEYFTRGRSKAESKHHREVGEAIGVMAWETSGDVFSQRGNYGARARVVNDQYGHSLKPKPEPELAHLPIKA